MGLPYTRVLKLQDLFIPMYNSVIIINDKYYILKNV